MTHGISRERAGRLVDDVAIAGNSDDVMGRRSGLCTVRRQDSHHLDLLLLHDDDFLRQPAKLLVVPSPQLCLCHLDGTRVAQSSWPHNRRQRRRWTWRPSPSSSSSLPHDSRPRAAGTGRRSQPCSTPLLSRQAHLLKPPVERSAPTLHASSNTSGASRARPLLVRSKAAVEWRSCGPCTAQPASPTRQAL